jgi:hypothetical protein
MSNYGLKLFHDDGTTTAFDSSYPGYIKIADGLYVATDRPSESSPAQTVESTVQPLVFFYNYDYSGAGFHAYIPPLVTYEGGTTWNIHWWHVGIVAKTDNYSGYVNDDDAGHTPRYAFHVFGVPPTPIVEGGYGLRVSTGIDELLLSGHSGSLGLPLVISGSHDLDRNHPYRALSGVPKSIPLGKVHGDIAFCVVPDQSQGHRFAELEWAGAGFITLDASEYPAYKSLLFQYTPNKDLRHYAPYSSAPHEDNYALVDIMTNSPVPARILTIDTELYNSNPYW